MNPAPVDNQGAPRSAVSTAKQQNSIRPRIQAFRLMREWIHVRVTALLRRCVVNLKQLVNLFRRSFDEWNRHNDTRLGAALAFYTILSISPLVILTIAI